VRNQIWTALIAFLLLKYLQFRARCGWALSHLVALFRWNLFSYRGLWVWLNHPLATRRNSRRKRSWRWTWTAATHRLTPPQPHFHLPRHPEGA
jgi:hypothetical protein